MANNFWWEAMAYIGILYRIHILQSHNQPLNVTIPFIIIDNIDEYVLREALGRREKLFLTMGDSGEQIYRPAVRLSK